MKALTPKLLATIVPLSFLPASVLAATFLTVSTTTGIVFGSLDDGATGGGFRVRPDGSSSPTGGSTVTAVGGVPPQAGQVSLIGPTGIPIAVSIATATVNVNGTAGGTMSVNDFQLNVNTGGVVETFTLTAPTITFPVGATLNVSAGQTAGVYTGTFTLNASY